MQILAAKSEPKCIESESAVQKFCDQKRWFKSNNFVQLYARLFGVHKIVNYK